MLAAAIRPAAFAARSALKPVSRTAVRAIATTPARRSGHPEPSIFGPGAKSGEVPTDENQSTGLERLQVLGAIENVEVFDYKPLDSSRIGTKADPIKVFSWVSLSDVFCVLKCLFHLLRQEPERTIGCTGSPAESHELLWMNLTTQKNRRCPECGSGVYLDASRLVYSVLIIL